jgi:hypothetical protein
VVSLKYSFRYLGVLSVLAYVLTSNSYSAPRKFRLMEIALDGLGVDYSFDEIMACGRFAEIERRLVPNLGDFDNQLYMAIKKDLVLLREWGNLPKFPARVYEACVGDCSLPLVYQSDEYKAETEKSEIAERTRTALEEIERQIVLEEQALRILNEND